MLQSRWHDQHRQCIQDSTGNIRVQGRNVQSKQFTSPLVLPNLPRGQSKHAPLEGPPVWLLYFPLSPARGIKQRCSFTVTHSTSAQPTVSAISSSGAYTGSTLRRCSSTVQLRKRSTMTGLRHLRCIQQRMLCSRWRLNWAQPRPRN